MHTNLSGHYGWALIVGQTLGDLLGHLGVWSTQGMWSSDIKMGGQSLQVQAGGCITGPRGSTSASPHPCSLPSTKHVLCEC